MSSDLTWNNETRHLRDLKPQQDNPRTISESQAKRLLESWDEYNQVETLAIGPDGTIYNGHQRYYTLLALGNLDLQVDVRVSSRTLTKDEWRKLTVFLHQGTVGEWDFEALRGWDTERLLEWGFKPYELGVEAEEVDYEEMWQGMPEFENTPKAIQSIHVHFENREAVEEFASLISQAITDRTRSIWHPEKQRENLDDLRFKHES